MKQIGFAQSHYGNIPVYDTGTTLRCGSDEFPYNNLDSCIDHLASVLESRGKELVLYPQPRLSASMQALESLRRVVLSSNKPEEPNTLFEQLEGV